jgi:flagellum-specific peptidoglycan hydrolase FlgJ
MTRRLECSACGATAQASCDCGAPYVTAGFRAAKAVKRSPEKSDRAIAAEIGVSNSTVSEARKKSKKSTVRHRTVTEPAKRIGRDGKARRVPEATRTKPKPSSRKASSYEKNNVLAEWRNAKHSGLDGSTGSKTDHTFSARMSPSASCGHGKAALTPRCCR